MMSVHVSNIYLKKTCLFPMRSRGSAAATATAIATTSTVATALYCKRYHGYIKLIYVRMYCRSN